MKSLSYYWNDFKKDFKKNKWSYVKCGGSGAIINLILGVVSLFYIVASGMAHSNNEGYLLKLILLFYGLPFSFFDYLMGSFGFWVSLLVFMIEGFIFMSLILYYFKKR